MTTEQRPTVADPWAKPVPLPPETPEETRRIALQLRKNSEFFDQLFDDLLDKQRGRFLLVYGDRQFRIYEDILALIEAKQALSKDDRNTAIGMRIAPWWPEYE